MKDIAQINPPEIRDALVRAAAAHDWRAIDRLTDNLVARGYCRPRDAYQIEPAARRAFDLVEVESCRGWAVGADR